ncbi:MAG: peptidase [Acidobacteriota bacterium]|nr:peptidase [Acidobacteriota bacterium]
MRTLAAVCFSLMISAPAFAGTKITIHSTDDPNVGLNDPTPVDPVGGNPGKTLGEQRMIALQTAADVWSKLIDTNVEIVIEARFRSLTPCDATTGVLASAGPTHTVSNFENAPKQDVWYPIALANRFAKKDLSTDADISSQFNLDVDNATCLGATSWYYGLDNKHGSNVDLITVALHEFAHGLGVSGTYNSRTGSLFQGLPSVFELHTFDDTLGLRWDQMTDAQRLVSQTNDQNLVWDGDRSRLSARQLLGPTPFLRIGDTDYRVGKAGFGGPVTVAGFAGNIVAATDESNESGPSTTDACTPLTNPAAITGRIALIDRGTCPFVVKAKNAQNAGAIAAIIVDNTVASSPNPVGGTDATITIPVLSVTKSDGDSLRTQLAGGVFALIAADPLHLSGADNAGQVKLFAPATLSGGSSVHHWDTSAFPNLLMEPNISGDLTHGVDITLDQLVDIGWAEPAAAGRNRLRRSQ